MFDSESIRIPTLYDVVRVHNEMNSEVYSSGERSTKSSRYNRAELAYFRFAIVAMWMKTKMCVQLFSVFHES